jgi:hypothetical protein
MMTFMDFMDMCNKRFSEDGIPAAEMNQTHVFYLGDFASVAIPVKSMLSELDREETEQLPLPFKDVSLVFTDSGHWSCTRIFDNPSFVMVNKLPEAKMLYYKNQEYRRYGMVDFSSNGHYWQGDIFHRGVAEGGTSWKYSVFSFPFKGVDNDAMCGRALFMTSIATWISHPSNYIIKTSPTLTPHETHRVNSGHSISARKRPYFIVVDHDVLVRMRRGIPAEGAEIDRASPTPHHRRGHWARLAERCRHARLLGKNRVWKRPAFVGDTKFQDEKNFYEVLLDFNKQPDIQGQGAAS